MDIRDPSNTEPARLVRDPVATWDRDSGLIDLANLTVLLVCTPGDDVDGVQAALLQSGLVPVATTVEALRGLAYVPRYWLVEASLAGALELFRAAQRSSRTYAIALAGPDEPEHEGLAAGADVVLRRPLDPRTALLCVERLRSRHELLTQSQALVELDRPHASAPLIETVLGAVSHEINDPLAVALANVQYVRDMLARGQPSLSLEEHRELMTEALAALGRMRSLMRAVASLVPGALELRPVSLRDVVVRAVESVRGDVAAEISVEADPMVTGIANGELVEHVVVRLLRNAVEATTGMANARVLVRVYATKHEARISVRDNGPRATADFREHVFEPFFKTGGATGTGIGLTLVRHAVLRMGGTLGVANDPAGGACFRVRLKCR